MNNERLKVSNMARNNPDSLLQELTKIRRDICSLTVRE